jgi:hypothetical protein
MIKILLHRFNWLSFTVDDCFEWIDGYSVCIDSKGKLFKEENAQKKQ